MKASIIDLRYKMKEILKAIDRNETVTVEYHGKEKCLIIPSSAGKKQYSVCEHPFLIL